MPGLQDADNVERVHRDTILSEVTGTTAFLESQSPDTKPVVIDRGESNFGL